jgi:V/A-type H+-transporting ATPase subunit K
MLWFAGAMTVSALAMVLMGVYFHLRPPSAPRSRRRWLKGTVAVNLLLFVLTQVGVLLTGIRDAMAQPVTHAASQVSVGEGLALIGIGLPTALAAIGAGIAVSAVGAAALAVIAEKPEVFGRSLVYLGLAEGIAIYGLVVTILMLSRI